MPTYTLTESEIYVESDADLADIEDGIDKWDATHAHTDSEQH